MSDTSETPATETTPLLMAKDPVCGMSVDPAKARGNAQHLGVSYCFCSPGCMHKFLSDPAKYIAGPDSPPDTSTSVGITPNRKVHKDPVCGMSVDPFKAAASIEQAGQLYHFCSKGCAEKFSAEPSKYLAPGYISGGMVAPITISGIAAQTPSKLDRVPARQQPEKSSAPLPAATYVCPMDPEVRQAGPGACPKCGMALEPEMPMAATRTLWTCPMHPEIVREGPGSCPICGMALEPMTVAAADEENPELHDMSRRFWWSLALSIPLMLFAMLRMGPLARRGLARIGQLDRVSAGNAGCVVVRVAVLRARLGIDKVSQPQHVHSDCNWRRSCLRL